MPAAVSSPLQGNRSGVLRFLAVALEIDLRADPREILNLCPLLERLHRIRPGMAFPLFQLGRYHYLQRDYRTARQYLGRVSGKLAKNPRLINLQARCSEKLGDLATALDQHRKSLAEDSDQAHVHFCIGRILLHDYVEASSAGR